MNKFWELLEQSIITQAIITTLVVGLWVYLLATGRAIPDTLTTILQLLIGFYFGSKVAYRQGIAKAEQSLLKRRSDYEEGE
jgi:hypothetical protein